MTMTVRAVLVALMLCSLLPFGTAVASPVERAVTYCTSPPAESWRSGLWAVASEDPSAERPPTERALLLYRVSTSADGDLRGSVELVRMIGEDHAWPLIVVADVVDEKTPLWQLLQEARAIRWNASSYAAFVVEGGEAVATGIAVDFAYECGIRINCVRELVEPWYVCPRAG